jgi:MFS family permease
MTTVLPTTSNGAACIFGFVLSPACALDWRLMVVTPLRKMLSVGFGNALAFYDFVVIAFFATQIARTFFPPSQTSLGALFTLAFFGLGFFTRPVGAIVIGYYGDTVGRKPAMVVSLVLMGISVVGLAMTPSYAQIGIAAPMLLLLFRGLQGFALGGEVDCIPDRSGATA